MIDKFLSVVGNPIEHSLSPLIHQVAYKNLGLDWQYDRCLVAKGELRDFIDQHSYYSGLSVTMPLKEEAYEFAFTKTHAALRSQTVNTLYLVDGHWWGANTDIFGLKMSLASIDKQQIKTVAILGAGATARSSVVAVRELFPNAALTIYTREVLKASNSIAGMNPESVRSLIDFSGEAELVINTTPVDFSKNGAGSTYWLNVNYANSLSEPEGAKSISGIEMLIWQAIAQIRIFTNGDEHRALTKESEIVSKIKAALALG